jgi:hypothetical protein
MTRKNKGELGRAGPVGPVPVVARDAPYYNETKVEVSGGSKV